MTATADLRAVDMALRARPEATVAQAAAVADLLQEEIMGAVFAERRREREAVEETERLLRRASEARERAEQEAYWAQQEAIERAHRAAARLASMPREKGGVVIPKPADRPVHRPEREPISVRLEGFPLTSASHYPHYLGTGMRPW